MTGDRSSNLEVFLRAELAREYDRLDRVCQLAGLKASMVIAALLQEGAYRLLQLRVLHLGLL